MDIRKQEIRDLDTCIQEMDKEMTMILQSLQWDRSHILEKTSIGYCSYDSNHKIPLHRKEEHDYKCFLKLQGYGKDDKMLPNPPDDNSYTLVKLNTESIKNIIGDVSKHDPTFIRGAGNDGPEPLTLERLQSTYSCDERRAIYDAVVRAVPSCHDLSDLALPSKKDEESKTAKSRLEVLSELRDMKRRRTKYRVAPKTKNYSVVLRDVIKSQMELYLETVSGDIQVDTSSIEGRNVNKCENLQTDSAHSMYKSRVRDEDKTISSNSKKENYANDDYNTRRIKIENVSYRHSDKNNERDRRISDSPVSYQSINKRHNSHYSSRSDKFGYVDGDSERRKRRYDNDDRNETNSGNVKIEHYEDNEKRSRYSDYGKRDRSIDDNRISLEKYKDSDYRKKESRYDHRSSRKCESYRGRDHRNTSGCGKYDRRSDGYSSRSKRYSDKKY